MFEIEEYMEKEFRFTINIQFDTKTELTPRMLEVSEAFGLGVSEAKKFTIYKDFRIGFDKGDVVFITGDSGGGKSLLLNAIYNSLVKGKRDCLKLDDLIPNPEDKDKPIVDRIGETTEESIRYLSLMGLNDAFIFLRTFKELSDGQKYRFKLAEILAEKPEFIFIDEFCANLDRTTAKVIAFNLQKICRKNNIGLFVATTHTDLSDDLNPSVLVSKQFMDDVKIEYNDYEKKKISFYNDIIFEEGDIKDYEKLSKYHYKSTNLNFPYSKIITAKYNNDIVGVAVYSPPFLQTKGRSIYFDKKYSSMTKEVVAEINKYFIRGSRYIISPKFRACGLGQKLTLESFKFLDKKYIEVITVMGKYNPVFERAGMKKIEITEETDAPTLKLDAWLKEKGLEIDQIHNPKYWTAWVKQLTPEDKDILKLMTGKVLHHPKIGLSSKDGKRAQVVAQEKRYKEASYSELEEEIITYIPKLYSGMTLYYIWENPDYVEKNISSLEDFGL